MKKRIACIAIVLFAMTCPVHAQYEMKGDRSVDTFGAYTQSETSFVFFDGMGWPSTWNAWSWGQSSLAVEEGAGFTEGTNAIRWTQGNEWGSGWTGIGFDVTPTFDMSAVWESDTLTFKLKADEGTGSIRIQLEDGFGKVGMVFDPLADGSWHEFAIPLKEMVFQDGSTAFDSSNIVIFGIMAEASGIAGQVIYIDDIWTGQPVFDEVPPDAPQNLFVATSDYSNLVIWEDVPGEEGEVYSIYYSAEPITSLEDENIEIVATDIAENTEATAHLLTAPVTDQEVSYYYAMVCTDVAHNVSDITATPQATTNTARGIVTISLNPPSDLICDGDLGEWAGIDPIRIYPSQGATTVPNYPVDGDDDLSVDVYLAVDRDFLYIACDVTDDKWENEDSINSWENDRIDVFIGLYDHRGKKHSSYERGEEPDYHFNFEFDELIFELPGLGSPYTPDSAWYSIDEKFPSGYVIETRLPWTLLAGTEDEEFSPREGMRIPIDFSIQDRDDGTREGILTWSSENQDQSWQSPERWTYTWIGSLWEPASGTRGDVNGDAAINVLDVLAVVNHILGVVPLTGEAAGLADCNGDGTINVLDALGIVNVILGVNPDCPGGAAKVNIYPETIEFLDSLKPYLATSDFSRLMAMVKEVGVPTRFRLSQNYPNPFNPVTTIDFTLPFDSRVQLSVYNVLGQEVKILLDDRVDAGYHSVTWNAGDMASGVYVYRLQAGEYISTKRCILLK